MGRAKPDEEGDIPVDLLKELCENGLSKLTQVSTEFTKTENGHGMFSA